MLAQPGRHRRGILEQGREDPAISSQDRIFTVEDIEGRGAIVSVDNCLDAVAHVIDGLVLQAGSASSKDNYPTR